MDISLVAVVRAIIAGAAVALLSVVAVSGLVSAGVSEAGFAGSSVTLVDNRPAASMPNFASVEYKA
jgi:hypothetical protein